MGNEGLSRRDGRDGDDEENDEWAEVDEVDQLKASLMPIRLKYLVPVVSYQVLFLITSLAGPLVFTLIKQIPGNCKTAPHYASHIIFLALQICLLCLSIWLHVQKWKSQLASIKKPSLFYNQSQDTSLLRTQGRCCRELITHMKLVDTYTNICFIALLINSYFAINTAQVSKDSILIPSTREDSSL